MADNQNVQFKLDLDNSDFMSSASDALGAIQQVGDPTNISGLISVLGSIGLALGTVAIAAYGFKEAIDLSEQAEDVQRMEDELNVLSAQAGISSTALIDGMKKASNGMIDTNTLIKDATEGIIKFGASASQLPQLMDIATKAASVFGGNVNQVFQQLTQALSTGRTEALKQYGIIVDSTKAVQDYAKANNLAANEITQVGKNQAIFNAALQAGEDRFKNVQGNVGETRTAVEQFKASLSDLKDMFLLVFDKAIGPSLHSFLATVNQVTAQAKIAFTASFGKGIEQNKAQIQGLEDKLMELKGHLVDLQHDNSEQGFLGKLINGDKATQIQKVTQAIAQTTATLNVLKQVNGQINDQDQKAAAIQKENAEADQQNAKDDIVNLQVRQQNQEKFNQELQALDTKYTTEHEKNINSIADIDAMAAQTTLTLAKNNELAIAKIEQNQGLNHQQKLALQQSQEKLYYEQLAANERDVLALRTKLLNDYVANSKGAFEGIGRAAKQMALQANAELKDFGKQGTEDMNSLKQNSVSAFTQMGQSITQGVGVAEAAATAIKNIFLGTIGDIAIQDGTRILMSGLGSLNPGTAAMGAALIAFGGALKAAAGSTATTTSTGAVATSSGIVSATNNGVTTSTLNTPSGSPAAAAATTAPTQRAVTVNIAGNYFNTAQTQQALMEMIRNETDATSFQYNSIGV